MIVIAFTVSLNIFLYDKICLCLALMHFNAELNKMLEILLQKICFAQALRVESWQNLIFFTHISVETIVASVVQIWTKKKTILNNSVSIAKFACPRSGVLTTADYGKVKNQQVDFQLNLKPKYDILS